MTYEGVYTYFLFQVFKIKFFYVLFYVNDLQITELSKHAAIIHKPTVLSTYSNGAIECTAVELQ